MKAKISRILAAIGFILAIGSLSACFDGPYYPSDPPHYYSGDPPHWYGAPHAYPEYYPRYYPEYVPAPRYYAYNARPYVQHHVQDRHRWGHERRAHHPDSH
jgi:hypothetical protein